MLSLLLMLSTSHANPPEHATSTSSTDHDTVRTLATEVRDLDAQIINGQRVNTDWFPAAGGLIFDGTVTTGGLLGSPTTTPMRQFSCSSTLIAPDVVLTAAHCVDEFVFSQGGSWEDPAFYWSRKADLSDVVSPFSALPDDAIRGSHWATPPEWDANNMADLSLGGAKYDIALLFLDEPVDDVTPALLTTAEQSANLASGDAVEIVGWGLTEPVGLLDSMSAPEPDTFGKKMWGASVLGEVGDYEIQVGDSEDDTRKCKGDSGGPTFMDLNDGSARPYRLIGVTSRSADFTQCQEKGGFDTRVDAYLDWIEEAMVTACEDGLRTACDEPGIPSYDPSEDEDQGRGTCSHLPGRSAAWMLFAASVGLAARRRRAQ